MAKVQPVDVALLGTINTLTVKYLGGDAEDTTAGLYYELSEVTEVTEEVENQSVTTSTVSKTISNGNYYMSEEEYAAWGEDNSYLLTLVAGHLGLTLI